MVARTLGTLTIGQAPRVDVAPILERHVPADTRLVHRGALDGLTRAEIAARYEADPDEPALITRLDDGSAVNLSRRRMQAAVQEKLQALESDGCDIILVLCTGTFIGLECRSAWLVEPDHVIPGMVAGLIERRQLGIVVPIAGQILSEAEKWRPLARNPLFGIANPYAADDAGLRAAGRTLQADGADAILLDCIGFTERHRTVLSTLGLPVMLSNAIVAKAVGELLEG